MDELSETIGIKVERETIELQPGESTTIWIRITNYSNDVDQFTLELDGLSPDWYTLGDLAASLFHNDSEDALLALHVPKTTSGSSAPQQGRTTMGIKPGDYRFTITAKSRTDPANPRLNRAACTLHIPGRTPTLSLSRERIPVAPGQEVSIDVTIGNPNQFAEVCRLEITDIARTWYDLPEEVTIGPHVQETIRLTIRVPSAPPVQVGAHTFTLRAFSSLEYLPPAEQSGTIIVPGAAPRLQFAAAVQVAAGSLELATVLHIENPGAAVDEYRLALSADHSDWFGLERDTVFLAPRSAPRAIGLTIRLPAQAKAGHYPFTLAAESRGDPQLRTECRSELQVGALPPQLTLQPEQVLLPRESAASSLLLLLAHPGGAIDEYAISLDGLDRQWYQLSPQTITLRDHATVDLVINPPASGRTKDGTYAFTITAVSIQDPTRSASVGGEIRLQALGDHPPRPDASGVEGPQAPLDVTATPVALPQSRPSSPIDRQVPSDSRPPAPVVRERPAGGAGAFPPGRLLVGILGVIVLIGIVVWSVVRHNTGSPNACAGAANAVEAVTRFYAAVDKALTDRSWMDAYNCFDANYQRNHSYATWVSGYKTTQLTHLVSTQPEGANAAKIVLCYVDQLDTGTTAHMWTGSWTLSPDNLLDHQSNELPWPVTNCS